MSTFKHNIPGILFCLIIAVPAWLLGRQFPIIGGPIFGILFGIVIAFLKKGPVLQPGINFTGKKILQYAIILLGFEMNLFSVLAVGKMSLYVIMFTLAVAFITAFVVGRALKIESNTTILIGVGTSICGGSAIAATAPIIKAEDEQVAQAISTIFLFNIIAVFIFPALGHLLGLSDTGFGMWAGTAVNDTSSVVAAATVWSDAAGNNTALEFATIVKLTRTLMIVPITLVLALVISRKSVRTDSAGSGNFSFTRAFPWFVLGFIVAAIINTVVDLPPQVSGTLVQLGKFMIVMALVAIGLNTDLRKLIKNGLKPIVLGLCCWFAVAVVSLIVQLLTKLL